MGRTFAWLTALGLALGAAGGASAATRPPMLGPSLRVEALPPVGASRPASPQLPGSEGATIWSQPPEPATLMLLATGLAGLVVLGHREFV